MSLLRSLLPFLLLAASRGEVYTNLIASADGKIVFLQARDRLEATQWYRLEMTGDHLAITPVEGMIADVDDTGSVVATADYRRRQCGAAGSTCFLQPSCVASFSIRGDGQTVGNSANRTQVRLSRSGRIAWIGQLPTCWRLGLQTLPLNGLYDTANLQQLVPMDPGHQPAPGFGRRLLTNSGSILTLHDGRLRWRDAAGARDLAQLQRASEAVSDAGGDNVVYVEEGTSQLHWITSGMDFALGLQGFAPALREDGNVFWYLDENGGLMRYDGVHNATGPLTAGTFRKFAPAGPAIFAITSDDRLVRIDAETGEQAQWLGQSVEVTGSDSPVPAFLLCPIYCYPELDVAGVWLGRGREIRLRGRFPAPASGWRIRLDKIDLELEIRSAEEAVFTLPELNSYGILPLEIYHPQHPLRFGIRGYYAGY